jgi:hypothetical protein
MAYLRAMVALAEHEIASTTVLHNLRQNVWQPCASLD